MKKKDKTISQPASYGLHLTCDGYGADSRRLADINLLYRTLNSLPEKIGMNKVGFPHIIQFTKPPIAGTSGFIFIIESHISIHTYSKQKFFSMDVYSCKKFDYKKVLSVMKRVYRFTKLEINLVERGNYFHASYKKRNDPIKGSS